MEERITIMNGFVEEIELPEGLKVDIIVSEWMGYLLYYEGMFDSVLFAKGKFLKTNGLLFPDKASIGIAGVFDKEN